MHCSTITISFFFYSSSYCINLFFFHLLFLFLFFLFIIISFCEMTSLFILLQLPFTPSNSFYPILLSVFKDVIWEFLPFWIVNDADIDFYLLTKNSHHPTCQLKPWPGHVMADVGCDILSTGRCYAWKLVANYRKRCIGLCRDAIMKVRSSWACDLGNRMRNK